MKRLARAAFVAAIIAVIALGVGFINPPSDAFTSTEAAPTSSAQPSSTPSKSPSPSPTPTEDTCPAEFVQAESNHEGNRVIGNFEERYAQATNEANNLSDAQKSLLLEEAGQDASVLAAWSYAFGLLTGDEANDVESLVEDGCLSRDGERLYYQFEGAISSKGNTFEEGEAPANGTNSGFSDGAYGVSDTAGVNGDLRAIVITKSDGTKVYILVRCGNPVYPGSPSDLPPVPTDNPPPPELEEKQPEEDPAPRGNSPEGGGENEDPGPGEYQPPAEVPTVPDTPRVDPEPPAPAPPEPQPDPAPAPDPVPTQDPAPAPEPEPSAPTPDDPETGCTPIPGVAEC